VNSNRIFVKRKLDFVKRKTLSLTKRQKSAKAQIIGTGGWQSDGKKEKDLEGSFFFMV